MSLADLADSGGWLWSESFSSYSSSCRTAELNAKREMNSFAKSSNMSSGTLEYPSPSKCWRTWKFFKFDFTMIKWNAKMNESDGTCGPAHLFLGDIRDVHCPWQRRESTASSKKCSKATEEKTRRETERVVKTSNGYGYGSLSLYHFVSIFLSFPFLISNKSYIVRQPWPWLERPHHHWGLPAHGGCYCDGHQNSECWFKLVAMRIWSFLRTEAESGFWIRRLEFCLICLSDDLTQWKSLQLPWAHRTAHIIDSSTYALSCILYFFNCTVLFPSIHSIFLGDMLLK